MPQFDVGDKVVYPHHGAAVIEKREQKEVFGESREYLILRLAYGDLTLMVPADNTDEVGLREVINDEEVEEVFAVLRKKEARMPTNWSRRYKNHVEKLKSGDIYQVAEVVRNLSIRDKDSSEEVRLVAGTDALGYIAATDLPALRAQAGFSFVSQDTVAVGDRRIDHLTYHLPAPPDPVTGKQVPSTIDRFYVPGPNGIAIVTLSTPDGVDNVDAFRQMIESFRWA